MRALLALRHRQQTVRCPAHADRRPSLSVRDEGDRLLLRCHAGCSTEQVCAALGVGMSALFSAQLERPSRSCREPEASYTYRSLTGGLLGRKHRYPGKQFGWEDPFGNPRKPDGITLYGVERLAEAIAAGRDVWVVAGEKDADALTAAGVVAVSLPNGDGSWQPEWAELFAGAVVILWPDADPSGWAMAEQVRKDLEPVALAVEVVEARAGANDAADHLGAGWSLDEVLSIDPGRRLGEHVSAADLIAAVERFDFPSSRSAPTLRVIVQVLAEKARGTGHVRIAAATLGLTIGRSRKPTEGHLVRLRKLGIVELVERGRFGRDGIESNLYRLCPPSQWKGVQNQTTSTPYPLSSSTYTKEWSASAHLQPGHDAHRYGALGHRGDEVRSALLEGPGTIAEVARRLGDADRGNIRYHLLKLVKCGAATRSDAGVFTAVQATDVLEQVAKHYGTAGKGRAHRRAVRRQAEKQRAARAAWRRRRHFDAPIAEYDQLGDLSEDHFAELQEPTREELGATLADMPRPLRLVQGVA